jgi:hypothetical protein
LGNRAKVDGELFPFGRIRSLTVHTARIQFYNFLSKTQSPCGPRRQQIIFRKSFQNTLKVLKSPPPLKKISLQSSLLNRTLCCICGGWGFSTFAPCCEHRWGRFANRSGSHKIGLSWCSRSSTGRLRRRRPYAKSQIRQTTANSNSESSKTANRNQVQGASGAGDPLFSGGGRG